MRTILAITALAITSVGCQAPEALPGPPINTFQIVAPDSDPGLSTSRARGVLELYLTSHNSTHTFWNDPAQKTDPWGTIRLVGVDPDGTVIIDFAGSELRARVGETFPGTGMKVIASNPDLTTALLRSRWTHTVIEDPHR